MKINEDIELLHSNCTELITQIPEASVDVIITDPPYLYLDTKRPNCEFDKPFDEVMLFNEFKRILKPTGFVLLFGRGQSFYRWNCMLADLGFIFKEEIIWNKVKTSFPFHPLGRRHENIAVFARSKKGKIRKNKIPYVEYIDGLPIKQAIQRINDYIKSIASGLKRKDILADLIAYLDNGTIHNRHTHSKGNNIVFGKTRAFSSPFWEVDRLRICIEGCRESDFITIPDVIEEGSFKTPLHPTQKPVRLMERLISLVTDEGDIVCDPFMGSGTTGIACINTSRRFIGMELDEKYFEVAKNRIETKITENEKNLELFKNEDIGAI